MPDPSASSAGRTAGTDPDALAVGVDFGTLSARAVVVRVADGRELGAGVADYPHAVIETALPGTGRVLPGDWALQHPGDWWTTLGEAVRAALADAGADPAAVVGIGTDFTASTVMPTLADGTPLCELPDLAGQPHAWPKRWSNKPPRPQANGTNGLPQGAANP